MAQWLEHRTVSRDRCSLSPSAAISNLEQFFSLHIAPVPSAVSMSLWLETVVDICEQVDFTQ